MSNFSFDESALERAIQPGIDRMQGQMTDTLRATLREVRDEMTGQPAYKIHEELVARLKQRIPGFSPRPDLRKYAEAIEKGELEG